MIPKQKINIAIADDHKILLEGLALLLSLHKELNILIQALDGLELINKIEISEIKPDICIVDINMPPGMDGYQALRIIKEKWPEIHIIILTQFYNEFVIIKTLIGGAACCLKKDISQDSLYAAILQVMHRGTCYSDDDNRCILQSSTNKHRKIKLSENEQTYLQYACSSLTHKEIAAKMGVSPRTVDSYRDFLCDKLGLKNRIELVLFAIRSGLVN